MTGEGAAVKDPAQALAAFHPRIRDWFRTRHGTPTDIQADAWPRIRAGDNVLATAPTGSGKTLCAFLAPLDHLISGRWTGGTVRVLYVSPLKALNNDVRRNLLEPLEELRAAFAAAGETMPEIGVATRSGDTEPDARRRMLRAPPEILITTPESLAILLTSAGGRGMLGGVRMVILDEIHAVAGSRRGLWLMHGVESLVEIAGEVQRVALSATVRPLDAVARLVGGHAPDTAGVPAVRPRPVACLASRIERRMDLRVEALPPEQLPDDGGLDALTPIARAVAAATARNRSTLVFANSRALCEKLALRINATDAAGAPLAWAHHGSLSREIRLDVEARLKAGRLKAIVATSSLEMGIDIGALDEVVMVQTPPSISACIQRAGRAGHQVGAISRAVLHPTHPHDVLEAAVVARAALLGDIEAIRVPGPCLDVLAQMLIARLAMAPRAGDALFDAVRCVSAFRDLDRQPFDLVVQMLLGRYADTRIRDLEPRLIEDPATGVLHLRRGTTLALYASGGMITDRGYYQLRHADTNARIGELDEEFVWENGPGRAFSLGSQQWRVQRVTHNDVFVTPAPEARHAPPFWRSEERDRDPHFALRLREFLGECETALGEGRAALDALLATLPLDDGARTMLGDHLVRQREHSGAPLPHTRHMVAECVRTGPGGYGDGTGQLVLHTFAGGEINRPWALALEARWQAVYGERPEVFVGNDAIVLQLGEGVTPEAVLALIEPDRVEELVRERLAGSGTFGARFRECAGRALLLTRRRFGERLPLWMSRLQAQRLLGRVRPYGDFPILLETWRSCLEEGFDLPALRRYLTDLRDGTVAVTLVHTDRPSPFAAQSGWRQINEYMYADDQPRGDLDPGLAPTLLESVVADARLRPRVTAATVEAFLRRRRRLETGWGPRDELELQDWLRERRLLPRSEFDHLRAAIDDATSPDPSWLVTAAPGWVLHARDAAAFARLATDDATGAALRLDWLEDWLAFQPPSTTAQLARAWPGPGALLATDLASLAETERALHGALLDGDDDARWCTRDAFEAMLRMQRAAARPGIEALPATEVPAFLARWQHLGADADLADALEPLRGLPLPAELWESALLPARTGRRGGAELDALLMGDELRCVGQGAGRIAFLTVDELDALPRGAADGDGEDPIAAAFPDPTARYDFEALRAVSDDDPGTAAARLWAAVFASRVALAGFEAVRHGLAHDFALPATGAAPAAGVGGRMPRGLGRRGALRARIATRVHGVPGRFIRLPPPTPGRDEVDRMERARTRARMLVDRWGVVSPSLLGRESRDLRWRELFRALRLMELAGEVSAGLFLTGLDGPQFAAPEALRWIAHWSADAAPRVRWMDARDPASPAGLGLDLPGLPLPRRAAGAELIMSGDRVAFVAQRRGASLRIDGTPDDEDAHAVLAVWARTFAWRRNARVTVLQINDGPARSSPWADALRRHLTVDSDHRGLILGRSEDSETRQ
ncbi:MAG TPA: DEAD/DEAH box helicase [Pseudomonadales bacterium]|nr:DEAD/DEAH box helicase [Pseudomonadales bacterium]